MDGDIEDKNEVPVSGGEPARLKVWVVGLLVMGALYVPQTPCVLVCLNSQAINVTALPVLPVVMPLYWLLTLSGKFGNVPDLVWVFVGLMGIIGWGYGLFWLSRRKPKLFWIGLGVSVGLSSIFSYVTLMMVEMAR